MSNKENKHEKLILLRNKIEKINSLHHIKFFEILKKNNIPFSENRNGIFFNMNLLTDNIVDELNNYIEYINKQEHNLKYAENLKQDIHNEFFKDNKDKNEKLQYTA